MKLNTATVLKDLEGLAIKDSYQVEEEGERVTKERDLTVGSALSGALVSGATGTKELTPTEAADMYGLAMKVRNQKEVTLKSEEVTLCKNTIVKAFQPIISGQVIMMLEPSEKK
jgi:hypothetical protein